MPRAKKHTAEEIIPKLRAAELEIAKGRTAAEAAKKIGVTEQTYYRWRKEYGGLRTDQAKRLKELEKENARLKRLLADAELDKAILKGGRLGKLLSPAKRRQAVEYVRDALGRDCVTERRACRVLEQPRSTQRRCRHVPSDEPRLITTNRRTGDGVRPVRLPPGDGAIASGGLAGESQTCRADLAPRRTKSAAEAAEASAALVE